MPRPSVYSYDSAISVVLGIYCYIQEAKISGKQNQNNKNKSRRVLENNSVTS